MDDKQLFSLIGDKNKAAVTDALKSGANANARKSGESALHAAIEVKSKPIVKALIAAGADVNAKGEEGATCLHALAQYLRDPKILDLMVEAGVDLDAVDDAGRTAMHLVCTKKKRDFMERLIEKGASLEVKDKYNQDTPLHQLLRSDSGVMSATEVENARFLIEKGARVDQVSEYEICAINLAAGASSREMIDVLIEKGAPTVRNKFGGNALHSTMGTEDFQPDLWTKLVDMGCSLEDRSRGDTVLMTAQLRWNHRAVEWCLANGADKDAKDDDGKTALERAEALGQDEVIKVLR